MTPSLIRATHLRFRSETESAGAQCSNYRHSWVRAFWMRAAAAEHLPFSQHLPSGQTDGC
jgi:hypothetical protein